MKGSDLEFTGSAGLKDRMTGPNDNGNMLQFVAVQILHFTCKIILGVDKYTRAAKQ